MSIASSVNTLPPPEVKVASISDKINAEGRLVAENAALRRRIDSLMNRDQGSPSERGLRQKWVEWLTK